MIKEKIKIILSLRDRPHHIAISFGIGVFIGMTPLLGIHTILGLAVSSIFRLNRLVTLMGVFITNPWTIVPIYTFGTWIGIKLLGNNESIGAIEWKSLNLLTIVSDLKELLPPFVAGTFFIGALSSLVSYTSILLLLKIKKVQNG